VTTDGDSTTAVAIMSLTPAMNKCGIINIVTEKANAGGAMRELFHGLPPALDSSDCWNSCGLIIS
jgi:hypothetical protein